MVQAAVKALLKEGSEVGSCDFGVFGGERKGRRNGKEGKSIGKESQPHSPTQC